MLEKAISGRKVKSGGKCRAAKTKIQLQLEIADEVEKLLNYLICNTHTDTFTHKHTHLGKENKKAAKRTQTKVQAAVVKICTKQINLHNTETFTNTNTQREGDRARQRQHTCLVGRNKAVPKIVSRCAMTERKPQIVFYIFDTILIFFEYFLTLFLPAHKFPKQRKFCE